MQTPEEAAAELERTVKDLGAKGVLINGFTNINKNDVSKVQYLDDPKCEPFWKKLGELDVLAKGGTKVHDGDMGQYWQSCFDDRFGWCLHAVILAGQQEAEKGKRFDRECGEVSIYALSR
jgi:hypothetical protein